MKYDDLTTISQFSGREKLRPLFFIRIKGLHFFRKERSAVEVQQRIVWVIAGLKLFSLESLGILSLYIHVAHFASFSHLIRAAGAVRTIRKYLVYHDYIWRAGDVCY